VRLEASQGNLGRTAAGMVYNVCDVRVALIFDASICQRHQMAEALCM